MTSPRRTDLSRRRRRGSASRTVLSTVLVLTLGVLILAGMRFLPGSPLAASAAPDWLSPTTSDGPARTAAAAPTPTPTPTPPPEKPLAVGPAEVTVNVQGWYGWAMIDQRTGEIYGSDNLATTSTSASLVKSWAVADFLRRSAAAGSTPNETRMYQASITIRDSDNNAAETLWNVVGRAASAKRMIKICDLTESRAHDNWSLVRFSPRDLARLGACIADGRAAGPRWTKWLLNEMRKVRGVGDFGIRKAFPSAVAKTIAIKNGWVVRDNGEYHVGCLAIGDGWTMAVLTRYPAALDYTYGARTCKSVAQQLRVE